MNELDLQLLVTSSRLMPAAVACHAKNQRRLPFRHPRALSAGAGCRSSHTQSSLLTQKRILPSLGLTGTSIAADTSKSITKAPVFRQGIFLGEFPESNCYFSSQFLARPNAFAVSRHKLLVTRTHRRRVRIDRLLVFSLVNVPRTLPGDLGVERCSSALQTVPAK